jgi:aryl-alcohol dehydrogenase-like predicted oxidoreductase
MEMTYLGATGVRVSRLCLGTMMFGSWGNPDRTEARSIIDRSIEAGVNFIDTADVYSEGQAEEIVGDAISGRRDTLFVATKFGYPRGTDQDKRGTSHRWIVRAVEESLRRLRTDYIDLYQIHRFDPRTDIAETLFSLTELVRQGKIRYFGSSMFSSDRIVEAQWAAAQRGLRSPSCEQAWYSLFAREPERFVLPTCERYGMGVLAFSPLDGGFLSGRYRQPTDLRTENRISGFMSYLHGAFDAEDDINRRKLALVTELAAIAAEANVTLAQLSIAALLAHPALTSVIIGPRTLEQLQGLLPTGDLRLLPETLEKIDALVPPGSMLSLPIHKTLLDRRVNRLNGLS